MFKLFNQKLKKTWLLNKVLICALCACTLLGCGVEVQDKNQPKNLESVALLNSMEPSQLSVNVVGQSTPNEYHVRLSWPKNKGTLRIYDNSNLKAEVPGVLGSFVDRDVRAGSIATYRIEFVADNGVVVKTWPLSVNIPLDVLLEGSMILTESKVIEAERIFLAKNLQLYTQNYDLTLKARTIFSDDGFISNFSSHMLAPTGVDGRPGGVVRILADQARGSLHVMLNGEDIGPGEGGATYYTDGDQRKRNKYVPKCGAPGKLLVEILKENQLIIDVQEAPGSSVSYFEPL